VNVDEEDEEEAKSVERHAGIKGTAYRQCIGGKLYVVK
jgi:hypothetical protein